MKFINREKEIKYLQNHFKNEPNSLLFVYGPKSSGKSWLLNKVANNLDKKKYAVNYISLRSVFIYDFKTFLDVFFQENLQDKTKDILNGITFNVGFFSIQLDDKKLLKKNAFAIIENKLASAKKRGIQPIIIIDEIQLLKHIYINGERYLIDQLFNLFIELTKVKHLAHIILSTSDSYFIEEIYNSAKLAKTSEFFLVDHFTDKTTEKWLKNLQFTDEEIGAVKDYIGGSPWEINQIINKVKIEKSDINQLCLNFVKEEQNKISNFIYLFSLQKEAVFFKVIKNIIKKGYCIKTEIKDKKILIELLKEMIAFDFWFYDAMTGKITANSKSIHAAFKKMLYSRSENADQKPED